MLVSLAIAALIIGGAMGAISESLRYRINLKDKAYLQPILESAAQIILADPEKAKEGFVHLTEFEGAPDVAVYLTPVPLEGHMAEVGKAGSLFRVTLQHRSASLEFSIIIPGKGLHQ